MKRHAEKGLWLVAGTLSLAVHAVLAANLAIAPLDSGEAGSPGGRIMLAGDSQWQMTGTGLPDDADTLPVLAAEEPRELASAEPPENRQVTSLAPDALPAARLPEPAPAAGTPSSPAIMASLPDAVQELAPQELQDAPLLVLPESIPVPQRRPDRSAPQATPSEPVSKPSARPAARPAPPAASAPAPAGRPAVRGNAGDQPADRQRGAVRSDANTATGSGTARPAQGASKAQLNAYAGMIRRQIRSRFRPGATGGAERDVIVAFTVSSSGSANSVRVSRSSGNQALDSAALAAVRAAAPFPPLPGGRSQLKVSVPLNVN